MNQAHSRFDTTFINTSGGILTEQLVRKLREQQCSEDAVKPTTFALEGDGPTTDTEFETEVTEAWESLKERWDTLSQNNDIFSLDTSGIRDQWSIPLLKELGFDPVYQQSNLEADGIDANLSHLGWAPAGQLTESAYDDTPPILHLVQPDDDPVHTLDSGDHAGSRSGSRSPHDELQRFLNAADQQWSVVTDGLKLRILRDYYHTYSRGYIEFDLENIFTNRNFEDFRALYRLCHASRFIKPDNGEAPLEQLYQVAVSTGVKIGEDLQSNVVEALETLGNGFLSPELREELAEGDQDVADAYFQDLLRIVYRLLFLLFAEQRGMMADRGDLYSDEYSITALRDRSERQSTVRDTQKDLWEGLQITFEIVGEGANAERLSVTGYNGGLFDDNELTYIRDSSPETELDTDAICPNGALLSAVHNLTHVEQEGYQQRISYADLGVDEIGAVYESLLEFSPKYTEIGTQLSDREIAPGRFYLDDSDLERKETGSYYTKPELVDELINSALEPVVDDRLEDVATEAEREVALLDIDVCDPACGSGAFLIAATNYLADRLASIRGSTSYPAEKTIREARRSVVQNCIYGVDLNPMAVELAKVSLWINSAVSDKPLNFLDHRIRCGNSLVGTNSSLVEQGLPDDAYETSQGRDWHPGNDIRRRIRNENEQRDTAQNSSLEQWGSEQDGYIDTAVQMESINEDTQADVDQKAALHNKVRESATLQQRKLVYDLWTAAFFWPMDQDTGEYPTPETIDKIRRNPEPNDNDLQELINLSTDLSSYYSFFHWETEFPLVFEQKQGFDCVLGNPPWEKIKAQPKEWFKNKHDKIASASKRQRTRLLNKLEDENPELYKRWKIVERDSERIARFVQSSAQYDRSAVGDLNTYPVFAEIAAYKILNDKGFSGIILKTGIATDRDNEDIFGSLVDDQLIRSFHDFRNSKSLFPDVHQNERFCLLTLSRIQSDDDITFSFLNTSIEDLNDKKNHMGIKAEEIKLINPNTKTIPTFQSQRSKDITINIHSSMPVLVNKEKGSNPWGITYYQMFHLTNDSGLWDENSLDKLQSEGYELSTNASMIPTVKADDGPKRYLPLYEGKHIHQYNHRFNSYDHSGEATEICRTTENELTNKEFEPLPERWVADSDFADEVAEKPWSKEWVFAFRDVADATTNVRTSLGTIVPFMPFGNTASLLFFDSGGAEKATIFTTLFNSFAFDFALRQSIGGTHVNKYILEQLPMPEPEALSHYEVSIDSSSEPLEEFLISRGTELIWTSNSLNSFGQAIIDREHPYTWHQQRREQLRAEIDATVAKLYGLSRDDFSYIIDTFKILKDREQKKYDEFRTKKQCLHQYDRIELDEQ